jgi:glycosyltransferase involved in cell wall biosynthesis
VIRINKDKNSFYYKELYEVVKTERPDIFHCQVAISLSKSQKWIFSILYLSKLLKKEFQDKIKIVYTFHQFPCQFFSFKFVKKDLSSLLIALIKHFYSFFLKTIYNSYFAKFVDFIIVVDNNYYLHIHNKDKVKFIPVPPNIPKIEISLEEKQMLRKKFGFKDEDIVLGYFGKIFEEKGFEDVIRVLSKIPNGKLLYIGKMVGNRFLLKKIKLLIEKLNLAGKIVETGFLSSIEVAKCLNILDAYVSLFKEGVSTKNASFLAAKLQGIFCIVTSLTKRGYYSQENTYYVSSPVNIDEVVKIIMEYKGKKINTSELDLPNWEKIAKEHIKVYGELLNY